MGKIKQRKIKIFVYIVIIVAVTFVGNRLYKGRKVHFADDKMRQVICLELGKDKNSHDVTYRDLETIEELKVGPVGEFKTIIDVAKCKNLKKLWVNVEITDRDAYYEIFEKTETGAMYFPPVSEKQIKTVQEDLGIILKNVKSIEDFGFSNFNQSCNITKIDFLKYGKNLKKINISYGNVEDYSVLENCSKLESVDLWYSNIESADTLLKLKNVKKFWLTGTPLAENEEKINKLQKAFPDAWIITE